MPYVILPDGNKLEVPEGATVADVAAKIGPRLAKAAIAGKVNGEVVDLTHPVKPDGKVEILTASAENADSLHVLRHSAAHVMAEAICSLFPQTKLVYGPPVDNGFYYDIDLAKPLSPEDFEAIEAKMTEIVKADRPFTRYEVDRDAGLARLRQEGNRYKIDNAERADGNLSFYVTGCEPGEPRTIYLTAEAKTILQAIEPDDPTGPVFKSGTGRPYTPAGLRSIMRNHGGITPYQLRHSFAQQVTDGGEVPLEVVSRLMGHRQLKTTERYFKVRDQRAATAAKSIRLRIAKPGIKGQVRAKGA